jgi:hypothetical protein
MNYKIGDWVIITDNKYGCKGMKGRLYAYNNQHTIRKEWLVDFGRYYANLRSTDGDRYITHTGNGLADTPLPTPTGMWHAELMFKPAVNISELLNKYYAVHSVDMDKS